MGERRPDFASIRRKEAYKGGVPKKLKRIRQADLGGTLSDFRKMPEDVCFGAKNRESRHCELRCYCRKFAEGTGNGNEGDVQRREGSEKQS